jgi:hypothetical protein
VAVKRVLCWNVMCCSLVQIFTREYNIPSQKTVLFKGFNFAVCSCSVESAVCLTSVYVSILNCAVKLKTPISGHLM